MPFLGIGVLMACAGLTAAYCSLSAIHERLRSQAIYDRAHEDFMANPNKVENRVVWLSVRELNTTVNPRHFATLAIGGLLFIGGLGTLLAGG